jgi:hypothetical protein
MAAPILYVGSRTDKVLKAGVGYDDDGVAYTALARSERLAPAGAGGECIFTMLYLTTRHYTSSVSINVTPIVDNVTLATQTIALTGAASTTGNRQTHELVLSLPYVRASVEQLRTAPRGTWIELLIESSGTSAKQIVESAEIEYEVVRETQAGEAR